MNSLKFNLVISYGSSFIGFLCMLLIARALGSEEYRWVAMGLAVGNVLSRIVELGSQATFVRDAVKKSRSKDVILLAINSFGIRLTSFIVCILVILFFAAFNTDSVMVFLGLVFLSAWVLVIGLYPASWYDYSHNTKKQNIFIFVERIFTLGICIILLLLPDFMQITLTVALPMFIVRLILTLKQVNYWLRENGASSELKLQFRKPTKKPEGLSYFVAAAMLSNAILTYGNQIILGLSPFKTQLPSYSIAFQIVGLIMIFQGQALRIFLREISEICKRKTNVKRNLLKHSLFIAIISAIMIVFIWVASKYLLPYVLLDNEFAGVHEFVLILGIWIIVAGIGNVVARYILAFDLDRHYMKISLLGGVVAFTLGLLLIPVYGPYAVAFILTGTHVAMILGNSINLFGYLRQHNIR